MNKVEKVATTTALTVLLSLAFYCVIVAPAIAFAKVILN
jgi:hypothetical protein